MAVNGARNGAKTAAAQRAARPKPTTPDERGETNVGPVAIATDPGAVPPNEPTPPPPGHVPFQQDRLIGRLQAQIATMALELATTGAALDMAEAGRLEAIKQLTAAMGTIDRMTLEREEQANAH
jgi:hypothetical protein